MERLGTYGMGCIKALMFVLPKGMEDERIRHWPSFWVI